MDPYACMARLIDNLEVDDFKGAREACDDLIDWLAKGGFEPVLDDGTAITLPAIRSLRSLLGRLQGGVAP